MTVYAINKQISDTSGTVPATTAKQVVSAEAAFSNALQSALNFNTMGGLPSASSALGAMFLHQQQQAPMQQASQPQQQPQSQAAPAPKAADNSPQGNDDQAQPQVVNTGGNAPRQTKSAKSDDHSSSRGSSDDHAHKDDQPAPANNDAAQQTQQQVAAAAVQVVAQQVVVQVADTGQQTAADTGPQQAKTGADPFAMNDAKAADAATKPVDDNAQGQTADTATPGFQRLLDMNAAKSQTGPAQQVKDDTAQVQAGPLAQADDGAAKTGAAGNMHDIGKNPADLAGQQAADLAGRLDGTGANLNIQVKTTATQQAGKASQDAAQGTTQDQAVQGNSLFVAQTTGQSQQDSGQQGGTQDDSSAPQATGAVSLQSAVAAQLTGDQGTFAAVLAAQADTNSQAAAPQAQEAQATQPIAGLNAADATQSTQKASPGQAAQAPTPPRNPVQAEVADQIAVEIQKHANKDGVDTIKVQLKPAELGRIEIKLEVGHDGNVSATVTADNKNTLAMLQSDSSGLSKALSDAGLKAQAGSLSFNLRGDQQQQQQASSGNNGQGRGGRRRALGGIDGIGETGTAAAMPRGRFGRSGVDISV